MNARLRKLVAQSFLEPLVVDAGRGSGIYAYGLGTAGRALLQWSGSGRGRGAHGPVWHDLEVAEFRVRLQEALEAREGEFVEWLGESALRGLLLGRLASARRARPLAAAGQGGHVLLGVGP